MSFSRWFAILPLLTFTCVTQALEPPRERIKEHWEAVYLKDVKIGHARTLFSKITVGGRELIESSHELQMTLVRQGNTLKLEFVIANHETPDGKVVGLVIHQTMGPNQRIKRSGTVKGNKIELTARIGDNPPVKATKPWAEDVLGLYAEDKFLAENKPAPNSEIQYKTFIPEFDVVMTKYIKTSDYEEVELPGGNKERLLRAEQSIDPVMGINMPPEIIWIDDSGTIRKRQMDMPGLGLLTMYRTSQELALKPAAGPAEDIVLDQLIQLKFPIVRPFDTEEALYRVRFKDVGDPETIFATGPHQSVKIISENELELTVKTGGPPGQSQIRQAAPKEYLKNNHFICSDNNLIQRLARRAVGNELDPWSKALRIGRWVSRNIQNKNFSQAFNTADVVARTLEGDCTEHSVLAAAMCRAVGVPSRTAIGLVYVPQHQALGYHMWVEVWVDGKWFALDPTLGRGKIGATHIKILDHHWNDVQGFTPLLPVIRVLGKLEIEVLTYSGPG